ncbi:MAG: septum formation inhibitor Maf [Hydrogenophilales bacterium]|nr:septum formation inhibitor Maf [Hydrogenophilales bacterium]
MTATTQIYLASQSPRRRELLQQIGIKFRVLAPDVNEAALPREAPADYVERIARIKAEVTWMRVVERRMKRLPVLAADTAVIAGRRILGKPQSDAEAASMLQALSGRTHQVITSVAMTFEGKLKLTRSETAVTFRRLAPGEIAHYVLSREPHDKAGAYAIQGFAAAFISRIDGSYSGVMGLPLFETSRLLKSFGIQVL